MKVLTIIRGLPGSSKSTLGKMIASSTSESAHYEADQYFIKDGVYNFNPKKIGDAHSMCKKNTEKSMKDGVENIVVSNTFTQKREVIPYVELAKQNGYVIRILSCDANFGSIHDVPEESIRKMKNRWENFTVYDLM